MEKEKRRNSKLLSVALIITSLLLVLTIALNAVLYIKNNELKNNNNKLDKTYSEHKTTNNTTSKEIDDYKSKIGFIEDINNNTLKLKEEYFDNIVLLENKINEGTSDKKIAYLTFDDGPYYLTYEYLNVLEKYNVKATFFTIGAGKGSCYDKRGYNCYTVLKEIADDGHTIANHTYSHAIWNGLYSSADSFINSILQQEKLINDYTGITTNIARFPGGSSTAGRLKNSIIEKLRENNYGWVDWTASDGDGGELSSKDQAWRNFKNSINQDIEVVLLHDYSNITLAILPDIIEYLQENNYLILPLGYQSNMINK